MLEPLLANAESSRLFVERGGADLLLKLYKLPRLTVSSTARSQTNCTAGGMVLGTAQPSGMPSP